MAHYKAELDLTGVPAPLHILRTNQVLDDMEVGDLVMVKVDARKALQDFKAYASQTGNRMVDKRQSPSGVGYFVLRKC